MSIVGSLVKLIQRLSGEASEVSLRSPSNPGDHWNRYRSARVEELRQAHNRLEKAQAAEKRNRRGSGGEDLG